MKYFLLSPNVPGWLGRFCLPADAMGTDLTRLHYVFDDAPHDCIVTREGQFVGTARLANELTIAGATGIEFDEVIVTVSEDFPRHTAHLEGDILPELKWFKITGEAGQTDFGLHNGPPSFGIVVSEPIFERLKKHGLKWCDVWDYPPRPMQPGNPSMIS